MLHVSIPFAELVDLQTADPGKVRQKIGVLRSAACFPSRRRGVFPRAIVINLNRLGIPGPRSPTRRRRSPVTEGRTRETLARTGILNSVRCPSDARLFYAHSRRDFLGREGTRSQTRGPISRNHRGDPIFPICPRFQFPESLGGLVPGTRRFAN